MKYVSEQFCPSKCEKHYVFKFAKTIHEYYSEQKVYISSTCLIYYHQIEKFSHSITLQLGMS